VWFAAALLSAPATAAAAEPPAPAFRHRLGAEMAAAIEPVVVEAARRLAEPECGRLLLDFSDGRGRPLQARLDEIGVDRAGYVALLVFVDGRNARACQRSDVVAVTNPGGRVVALCPAFVRVAHLDRRFGETIVIHETLHSLGLGENPPASREVNQRVSDRCRR
jgi:hypothetical protein